MPPPPPSSSNGPRFGFQADNNAKTPFRDPFPQVPNSTPAGAHGGSSNDPGFDDLARRFEDLKNRK